MDQCPIESVKLANFTFAARLEKSNEAQSDDTQSNVVSRQALMEEVVRSKEIIALYEIAVQIAEKTAYVSSAERSAFQEAIRILDISSEAIFEMEQEIGLDAPSQLKMNDLSELVLAKSTETAKGYKNTVDRLEFFADTMWEEPRQ